MRLTNLFAIVLACVLNVLPIMSKTYDAEGTHRLKVSTCVRVGGIWGEKWNRDAYKVATQYDGEQFIVTLYSRNDEVWNYYCKIIVNDFAIPDKKLLNRNKKTTSGLRFKTATLNSSMT